MYGMSGRKKIEWGRLDLPNIPIFRTKLPDFVMNRLWEYVDKAVKTNNHTLAGNITKSMYLEDEDNWFEKEVLQTIIPQYMDPKFIGIDAHMNAVKTQTEMHDELVMNSFWVNFQNKHEFNPVHNHGGVFSFVIWMKIPTDYREQRQIPFVKNSNSPQASDFQFSYSDILGQHQVLNVEMDKTREGWMVVFPAQLKHQVYPFYNSDETRISISGNLSLDSHKHRPFYNR